MPYRLFVFIVSITQDILCVDSDFSDIKLNNDKTRKQKI